MPRGDSTGPVGAGPMTGRGMGLCAGYGAAGFMYRGFGGGMGRGRGFGRGFGFGSGRGFGFVGRNAYGVAAADEKEILKNETHALETELKAVKAMLS